MSQNDPKTFERPRDLLTGMFSLKVFPELIDNLLRGDLIFVWVFGCTWCRVLRKSHIDIEVCCESELEDKDESQMGKQ